MKSSDTYYLEHGTKLVIVILMSLRSVWGMAYMQNWMKSEIIYPRNWCIQQQSQPAVHRSGIKVVYYSSPLYVLTNCLLLYGPCAPDDTAATQIKWSVPGLSELSVIDVPVIPLLSQLALIGGVEDVPKFGVTL